MKNKKKQKLAKSEAVVRTFRKAGHKTDPQGSYTGQPSEKNAQPIQDADDL